MNRLAYVAVAAIGLGSVVHGQNPRPATPSPKPIQDNSFLLEEAYNQEAAVIQHINVLSFNRTTSNWQYALTDEWPVNGQRHQLSLTVPVQNVSGLGAGLGDVALNYRLQLVGSGETRLAITPRLTAIFPTTAQKYGGGALGIQGALASSYAATPTLIVHSNAGVTVRPNVDAGLGRRESLLDFNAGQSLIWLAHQRFNLMLEGVLENEQGFTATGGRTRGTGLTLSPGFRWSHDLESGLQIVPGVAFPMGFRANDGQRAVLFYLSFEHEMPGLRNSAGTTR